MHRANTLETRHIQGWRTDKFLFFISFLFISVLIFVEKSMTVLLPNKIECFLAHFQKKQTNNEHVDTFFWQSRVKSLGCYYFFFIFEKSF